METFFIGLVLFTLLVFFCVGFMKAFSPGYTFFTIITLFLPPIFLVWVAILGMMTTLTFFQSRSKLADNDKE